ncbi:MAG TPA: TrmH family RNA methyltransferase [Patescibacteria group bacterium]|nr:TrmH family RNA methyltransferase [Patescibacteria group bacterium]
MIKLGAKELRTTQSSIEQKKDLKKNPIYIICDNILDTYNVGSIFRLADAVAASKVYLCGITETPPNTRIKKASINTTEWVDWEYVPTTLEAITSLKSQIPNIQIVLVEQDARSVAFDRAEYTFPIALIVSNESSGAEKEVLDAADMIVEMPMFGVNKSLNVMVSLGIVLYQVIQKMR